MRWWNIFLSLFIWKTTTKTRDILYVKGFFKGDEKPLHIFVNHWPSRREGQELSEPKRISASESLKYQADKIIEEEGNPNIMIMGDFNDYPGQ